MPRRSERAPKESLRLTLESAATPEVVEHIAAMFNETLRQIAPELRDGVTMRVENYTTDAELRAWRGDAIRAVRLTAELVDNATEAVQKHGDLAPAARTLAFYAAKLTVYQPKFWRNDKELRAVDDVFVRTMRAAGQTTSPRDEGDLSGDTTVYSAILRVGRTQESGPLQARIRIQGVPSEVDVADDLVAHVWEVARTGEVVPLRLRGKWVESDDGGLRLKHPLIVGINSTFARWSGHELLEDLKQHSSLFSSDDFERMLEELEAHTREE